MSSTPQAVQAVDDNLADGESNGPLPSNRLAVEGRGARTNGPVLRVVDLYDGTPLASLPFKVFGTGVEEALLLEGQTDGAGLVPLGELPRVGIVVRTARQVPHAEANQAFDSREAGPPELLMRVGKGGSIRGRVQDERGKPLEGVAVHLRSVSQLDGFIGRAPLSSEVIVATTDRAGRFQADHLLSRPRRFEWVGDELQMSRADEVELQGEGNGSVLHD